MSPVNGWILKTSTSLKFGQHNLKLDPIPWSFFPVLRQIIQAELTLLNVLLRLFEIILD